MPSSSAWAVGVEKAILLSAREQVCDTCRMKANDLTNTSLPSDSELRLLRTLWQAPRLSAREVHEAAGGDALWSFSSTRKTLERMVEKRLITVTVVHGIKTFAATEPKLRTLAGLIRDFTRNVLDKTEPMPAATFVNSKLISPNEIKELETLLKQLTEKQGKRNAR